MAAYNKLVIKLDAVLDRQKIVDTGKAYPDFAITKLSVAAQNDVVLHVGEGGDPLDLREGWVHHVTPPETTGLYVSVLVAHPGETVNILVGYTTPE
jgi:hypothetical protein